MDNNRRFNHGSKQGRFELKVGIPVNAPVGLWRISIETWYADKWSEKKRFKSKDPVYILFNPFDESDPVHLPHNGGQDEFLFNETGKLYGGSHNNVQGRPWVFGQLRDSVLPAVCHLLDNKAIGLKDTERSDPIRVSRYKWISFSNLLLNKSTLKIFLTFPITFKIFCFSNCNIISLFMKKLQHKF